MPTGFVKRFDGQPSGRGNFLGAPDAGDTVVGLNTTQTLTNKTLTTPTITNPSITSLTLEAATLANTVFSGTATGTYTLAGTPTITAPAISAPAITGAATIADGATITTPILTFDVQSPLAGTGTTVADAAPITCTAPGYVSVTGSNNSVGVLLPTAAAGKVIMIKNNASDVLKVYAAVNSTINAVAANSAFTMASLTSCTFVGHNATAWMTFPLVAS